MASSFIVLLSLLMVTLSHGFLQELILSEKTDETGNIFIFRSQVADTSLHNLGTIERVCGRGIWYFFDEPNFIGRSTSWYGYESNLFCGNTTFDYKSFRHFGAIETSNEVLSLYSEKDFHGEEVKITEPVTAHISVPIQSLSLTGPSNWTLFDGTFFNGTNRCIQGVPEGSFFDYHYSISGLETVGSVLKGCDF